MTLALRRLDPDNALWEERQRQIASQRVDDAFWIPVRRQRGEALQQISDTFERYKDSDMGRKLYLIQRCIFGVDNDPNATDLAKLRFFISLAIEQQPNKDSDDNYGIRPLPNLDTRFVTADTLLSLDRPLKPQLVQRLNEIHDIERRLASIAEEYFGADTREEKMRLRDEYKLQRGRLAGLLQGAAFPPTATKKLADWSPMDQNLMADTKDATDWFDPEYMFGVKDGFDVVIGNPPYVQLQRDGGKLAGLYRNAGFSTFARTGDIYQLFYERGFKLLANDGLLSYITSNSWLKAEYGKSTRSHIADKHTVLRLLETGKDVFANVIVDTSVLVARNGKVSVTGKAVDTDRLTNKEKETFPPEERLWSDFRPQGERPWSVLSPIEQSIMKKMNAVGTPLKEWDIVIYRGITTGLNEAFIIDNQTKEGLIAQDPRSEDIIKPVLRGRDIERYRAKWAGMWLIDTHNGYEGAPPVEIDDYPAIKTISTTIMNS